MGDGYRLSGTGEAYVVGGVVELPEKVAGRHRWVAVAGYSLSAGQAAAVAGGAKVSLGPEMIVSFGVGCFDCEEPYDVVRGAACPVGDER